jgi:hypothetical protein
MVKWYEGGEEAAFKPMPGGYVFQPPSLFWPFVRGRGYRVNETQKAELAACLRRQRGLIFLLLVAYVLIGLGLAAAIDAPGAPGRISTAEFIAILAMTMLGAVPIVILPHIYLVRTLRPLLADLPRTEERISLGHQLRSLAAAVSVPLLLLGGLGGGLMIIGSIISIVDAVAEGRGGSKLYWSIFGLLFGALLTSYFAYLTMLKRKLKRQAS